MTISLGYQLLGCDMFRCILLDLLKKACPLTSPMQIMDNMNVFYYLSWLATVAAIPFVIVFEGPKVGIMTQ